MLGHRGWTWLAVSSAMAAAGFVAAGGCAGGTADTFEDDDDDSGTGGTGGTATGGGGTGGTGTTTNTSMCDIDCSTISTPDCQVSVCNEGQHRGTVGVCVVVPDEEGVPCEDGLFCSVNDSCLSGICESGTENDCGMTPGQCMELTCNETSQTCSETASAPGAACQDPNNLCMKGGTCNNGLCTGGTPEDCFFTPVPDDCHVAECNPQNGQCEPVAGNEGQACVDLNDLCTPGKTCASGLCQGGAALDCTYLTQGCNLGVCDTNNGQCTTQNLNNGDPCDDLSACTVSETCQNGTCSNGTSVITCEQNGDGCCPNNCTASNDIDCTVQPTCLGIKTSVPNSPDGIYIIDPDLSGPIPQTSVYCDMTADQGGWTLIARISNADADTWMLDSGLWWYDEVTEQGSPTSRTANADALSRAFWTVPATELKISRTDNGTDGHLIMTTGNCLGGANFRAYLTSWGDFRNGVVWGSQSVASTCPGTLGNNWSGTLGFGYATCSSVLGAPNSVSFWVDAGVGDGAVMMIGGGGDFPNNSCVPSTGYRADHGIGITEANAASFADTGAGEGDFGDNASVTEHADPGYALNLFVR
jgi:hypothetical protein